MKLLTTILFFTFSIFIIGCSDDDSEENLIPEISLVGTINGTEWNMKFGRTLTSNFFSYSEEFYDIIIYSDDWEDQFSACNINSFTNGFLTFKIKRETGTFIYDVVNSFSTVNEGELSFYIPGDNPDILTFSNLASDGEATVKITTITENEIVGSISASASNGTIDGVFVVDICK